MRKLSLLTVVFLTVGTLLIGCGDNSEKKSNKEKEEKPMPEYEAKIDDMFTCGSKNSGERLVVNLKVKNLSEESLDSFSPAYDLDVYVDDNLLETTHLDRNNPYYVEERKIKSGKTGISQSTFSLEDVDYDDDSEIELILTVHDFVDYRNVVVLEKTVSMSDVDIVESESEIEVALDNVTVTDNGEGTNLLVLDFTFTNNSDDPISFGKAVDGSVFQAGIELKSGHLPYKHPMYDDEVESTSSSEIKSGASVVVRRVYELRNDSNVEIQLTDSTSFDNAVILDTEIEVGTAEAENASGNGGEENPLDDDHVDEL